MLSVRKFCLKLHQFFQVNYPYIWFMSVFTIVFIGFLHYELKHNSRDLIYWKDLLDFCYNELEHFALILIMVVVLIKVIFLAFIIVMNSRSFTWFDELSQLEVKKRYADFLFIRLIADIDKIESKYLRSAKENEIASLKSFILAHEDMRKTIDNFRKDARKLLTPNEIEVSLPIDEVYGLMDDEEKLMRRSRFYHMDISADDELIKSLTWICKGLDIEVKNMALINKMQTLPKINQLRMKTYVHNSTEMITNTATID
ncbi:unnamed protein product [Ceratitis capitata]|uniref:(Mediterranean fruit fly) hypothetical protein n=1 Tax=Ceratitis capitata TaxID=7213 RepID=A0A811UWI9_CERCA|nr:unnamed protein product [Ceratitis capitata]